MASYFHQAGESIGLTVKRWSLDGGHNWGNLIPADDWGMTAANWAKMLSDILADFANQIAPAELPSGQTFPGAREQELYKLQRRLSDSVL